MSGSNMQIVWTVVRANNPVEELKAWEEKLGPSEGCRTIVTCKHCGKLLWARTNNKRFCSPECIAAEGEEIKRARRRQQERPQIYRRSKSADELMLCVDTPDIMNEEFTDSEKRIFELNERRCCTLYESNNKSIMCFFCKRGKDYTTGSKDVSNRCCPTHPLAADGSRYLYAATHRKDSGGDNCGAEQFCINCMSKHIKIPMAVRSVKMEPDGCYCYRSDGSKTPMSCMSEEYCPHNKLREV